MNTKAKVEILQLVSAVGFDMAFDGTLTFDDINDPEFHRVFVIYKRARRQLAEYVGYPDDLELLEKESQM